MFASAFGVSFVVPDGRFLLTGPFAPMEITGYLLLRVGEPTPLVVAALALFAPLLAPKGHRGTVTLLLWVGALMLAAASNARPVDSFWFAIALILLLGGTLGVARGIALRFAQQSPTPTATKPPVQRAPAASVPDPRPTAPRRGRPVARAPTRPRREAVPVPVPVPEPVRGLARPVYLLCDISESMKNRLSRSALSARLAELIQLTAAAAREQVHAPMSVVLFGDSARVALRLSDEPAVPDFSFRGATAYPAALACASDLIEDDARQLFADGFAVLPPLIVMLASGRAPKDADAVDDARERLFASPLAPCVIVIVAGRRRDLTLSRVGSHGFCALSDGAEAISAALEAAMGDPRRIGPEWFSSRRPREARDRDFM